VKGGIENEKGRDCGFSGVNWNRKGEREETFPLAKHLKLGGLKKRAEGFPPKCVIIPQKGSDVRMLRKPLSFERKKEIEGGKQY